ncbi:HNH endonuclease [Actinomyces howellii]|uniref:HNH endonuclease n=1 Tax=Actinomyces howellii TaxID=52771 RepID=UPI0038B79C67
MPGCQHRATEADHVVPVAEGGAMYDPLNGQAACGSCHMQKTQREAARGRQRRSRLRPPTPHPGLV